MSSRPVLVFIPGSWHKPTCYRKVIQILQDQHNLKCVAVTLPSTQGDPNATFKDDFYAARDAITSETTQGRNVIVISHSYGGMVGNSAVRGLTRPKSATITSSNLSNTDTRTKKPDTGYVEALVLIASGHTITGFTFMDPFLGIAPPAWRVDKETGYATLVADPREFFYHDLPEDEANYWVDQLTTQSLKSLFEGGEYSYAGWVDIPSWYIGTIEDRGLPVTVQRMGVSMARSHGAVVHHTELKSSHSPFLSMPDDVVEVILDAVEAAGSGTSQVDLTSVLGAKKAEKYSAAMVRLTSPTTWPRFGVPLLVGRIVGYSLQVFMCLRRLWSRK
ncbi:hypothetical protein F53441_14382 [Fusarium austroafricanum]|uniref:AB hydrolase-1 domain-containing protein n=1 Tax=Fusarium austroafricanum TaxID=2364996 RepID=A0A8H4JDP0_9HYPO|nr:hypothetical protein F53441_14382 [Fusarium austroafricanum]